MRPLLVASTFVALWLGAATAQAEKRIFIIANEPDGYGVDRCLATSASCGGPVAAAFCRAREFNRALSYHKIDRDDITGAVPRQTSACRGGQCENFVAIECSR
jgi:hypothetical protein